MSDTDIACKQAPRWFRAADKFLRVAVTGFSCLLLVLMVAFTVYTVVMRYVFHDPPFWGDTVSLFCNIGLVFIAYSLAVRDREDIASEALHAYLPKQGVTTLVYAWQVMTIGFGVFLAWFGMDAALTVPGQYWELGGLPKMAPMLALPLCGLLIAISGGFAISEDIWGWQRSSSSLTKIAGDGAPTSADQAIRRHE